MDDVPEKLELTIVGQDNVKALFEQPNFDYEEDEIFGKSIKGMALAGSDCEEDVEIISYRIYKTTAEVITVQGREQRSLCKALLKEKEEEIKILNSKLQKAYEMLKQTKGLVETIKWFEHHYGKGIKPYIVLQQLYKSGRVKGSVGVDEKGYWKEQRKLVSPRNFKIYNTSDKTMRDGVNYWLGVFETLEIFDSDTNERYALVTYGRAKEILRAYFSPQGDEDEK